MTAQPTASLLFEHSEAAPLELPFPNGEVIAFSARGPDKPVNEDAIAVLPHPEGGLLAIADGMGGQVGGARASRATLEQLSQSIGRAAASGEQPLRHVVLDGLEVANTTVQQFGVGAGTTFAGFVLRQGRARAVHVGDSMALHVGQRGRIKAQTISHSPTGYAIEAGMLDEQAALHHEDRHLVSNFVGMPGMRIEVGPPTEIAPRDTLLVASDGLTDNLALEEIVAIVRKGALRAAALQLAQLAQRRMADPAAGAPSKPDDLSFLLFRQRTA